MNVQLKEKKGESRILPNKERSRELIALDIRMEMTALVTGKRPWPWYLWGNPGVGKTCCVLCMLDFASGMYYTADQWASDLNEARLGKLNEVVPGPVRIVGADDGWRYGELHPELIKPGREVRGVDKTMVVTPADLWRRMKLAELFVLDDVGMRDAASEHQRLSVKRVLDDRCGLPVVVIGNRPPGELKAVYGEATARRLIEGTVTMYPSRRS